jgi:hypothetical protein
VVGKQGRVTGLIGPGLVGEVIIPIRGGSEAFYAYASEPGATIEVNESVLVIEYVAPRTVYVVTMQR